MTQIKTETEYYAVLRRIEELLPKTWDEGSSDISDESIELALLFDLVADYEDERVRLEDIVPAGWRHCGKTSQKLRQLSGFAE